MALRIEAVCDQCDTAKRLIIQNPATSVCDIQRPDAWIELRLPLLHGLLEDRDMMWLCSATCVAAWAKARPV